MRKSQYIAALSIIASIAASANSRNAFAKDDTEELIPPLIYIVLDTSGSMNEGIDDGLNNTRLTKALAELAGSVKTDSGVINRVHCDQITDAKGNRVYKDADCPTKQAFDMPYPVWKCTSGNCVYEYVKRMIPGDSEVAKPDKAKKDPSGSMSDYRTVLANNYTSDGIIQAYGSTVKFGAVGLAVGSEGSSSDKDATSIQKAAELAGGRVDGVLRSTIIWNDDNDNDSDSDIDFHAAVYRNGHCIDKMDYCMFEHNSDVSCRQKCTSYCKTGECIKYGSGLIGCEDWDGPFRCKKYKCLDYRCYETASVSDNDEYTGDYCLKTKRFCTNKNTGGVLDVDIIYPHKGRPEYGFDAIYLKEEGYNNPLGVENIVWKDVDKLKPNDVIYLYAVPYSMHRHDTSGFRGEISYKDTNGCQRLYKINYSNTISGSTSHNTCGRCLDDFSSSKDIPIAKIVYKGKNGDGDPMFEIGDIGNFGGRTVDLHEDMESNAGKPDYIYGYTSYDSGITGVQYGRSDLKGMDYKKSTDCTLDVGMWDSNPNAPAPLFYPTPSNNSDEIKMSNDKLVDAIRSYRATSATPLGETLADLYYMFGADKPNYSSVDKGLVKRMTNKGVITDNAYTCREKAVILITDGEPNGSGLKNDETGDGHGHSTQIWYDARHLSKNKIKTYVIAYAFGDSEGEDITKQDPAKEGTKAYALNKTAWYGGTCRDPVTKKIINPDPVEGKGDFEKMLKNDTFENRRCFYNASNSDALRKAMAEAMSDSLQGTVSKTAVASSTALGYVKNTSDSGKFSNGYYNVYSGYQIKPGLLRRTMLQREATVCNRSTGEFETGKQHLDMSTLLSCRLNQDCMNATGTEAARIAKDLKNISVGLPCAATDKRVSAELNNANSCLDARYVFAGDYSEDRYAVEPGNIALNHAEGVHGVGYIKNALGSADTDNYDFVVNAHETGEPKKLRDYVNKDDADYILSPYECGSDLDCIKDGKEGYCDLGRCVNSSEFRQTSLACSTTETDSLGRICIANRWRTKGTACESHADCTDKGKVCHAGFCLDGVVKDGDITQFLATMPLGTVEYANPVIVEPPTRDIRSRSYEMFSKANWNRDNMLMVAANDGMLHAFILGQNEKREKYELNDAVQGLVPSLSLKEGDELWAFVPKTTMPKLKSLTDFGQQTFLNATPVVADVPDGADTWHTVILGGFGNGGRGYYALDITDPLSPKVLWEIDNQWQAASKPSEYPSMTGSTSFVPGNSANPVDDFKKNASDITPNEDNMGGYPFADLGYASAKPLITRMIVNNKLETVAILPGGKHSSANEGFGAIYIVRLFPDKDKKNLLVASIYTKYDVTSAPAVFPNNFNATAQRLYFGDSAGNFYALDVSNFKPSEWRQGAYLSNRAITENGMDFLKPAFGPECGHITGSYPAITYKPAVSAFDNRYKPTIQIVFGTGDNSALTTGDDEHNYVAVLYDTYTKDGYKLMDKSASEASKLYVFNPDKNIKEGENGFDTNTCGNNTRFTVYTKGRDDKLFDATQKMSGSAVTYNFVTYFPTYISSRDTSDELSSLCTVGNAAIYRLTPSTKPSHTIFDSGVYNSVNNKKFMEELEEKGYANLASGTKIYGLEMTAQQLCIGDSKTTLIAPRLLAQTGVNAAALDSNEGKLKDMETDLANFAINLDAIQPAVKPVSWASVYE